MRSLTSTLLFLAIFFPVFAHAETVLRVGEDIAVDADQTVQGDYYVSVGLLGNTTMSGNIQEDMYALGGSVTANGAVGGDMTIIGGTSQLHATVTDDVRVLGGEVTIGEHVGGDLFVIAGKLTVLSTATIDGDVLFFGGDAEVNGKVSGSVLGTSERMRIDAQVGKNVDVKTVSLTLGEKAAVAGNVTYESPTSVARAQNATIEGEVIHKESPQDQTAQDSVKGLLVPIFISLFASLTLFLLFKREIQEIVQHAYTHPLRSMVSGTAVLLLFPLVSVILIATILGMVIGIAGLFASVFLFALGYALAPIVMGALLSRLFSKRIKVSFLWIIIGAALLHALLLIPFLGISVFVLILLFSMGGVWQFFYKLLT